MEIRKMQGDADGWQVAQAVRSCKGWDDDGAPFDVVGGESYYIKGEVDPNYFTVDGKPTVDKKSKPTVDLFVGDKEEDK